MSRRSRRIALSLLPVLAFGCTDRITQPDRLDPALVEPANIVARLDCRADLTSGLTTCVPAAPAGQAQGPSYGILGTNEVKLRSANNTYDSISEVYAIDVTVENLLPEPIGTPDGVTKTGLKVFFHRATPSPHTTKPARQEPPQSGTRTERVISRTPISRSSPSLRHDPGDERYVRREALGMDRFTDGKELLFRGCRRG